MKTELELVYYIINNSRNAEHNDDEAVTERLIRTYIRNHRADIMRKHYKNGIYIADEIFQNISLRLIRQPNGEFMCQYPKLIHFEHDYGFYIQKDGVNIPITRSHRVENFKKNFFGRNFAVGRISDDKFYVTIPNIANLNLDLTSDNGMFLNLVNQEILEQEIYNNNNNPGMSKPVGLTMSMHAILFDPSDDLSYDWESDTFPFPSERMLELGNQILAKEYGIMAASKKDEVQNARADIVTGSGQQPQQQVNE